MMLVMALLGAVMYGTYHATTWGMQASGLNCAWRKWGEQQGWKQDVPAKDSEYCRGHE